MSRVSITTVAVLALAYLALPLVVILGASLTRSQFLVFPPQGVTLDWYARVLADPSYLAAFWTSSLLASAAAGGALVLGISAALVIGREGVPGSRLIGAALMSPLVLPHVVLGAAFLQFCAGLGLVRTFWALLLGHIVVVTPFVMQAVLPLLTTDQRALEEASRDLGAGWWSTFRLVTLPTIRGGVVSGGLFAFISSWINVEMSMFNTTSAMTTVPVKLLNHVQYQVDPLIAAVSGLTIIVAAAAVIAIDVTIGLDVLGTRK